MKASKFNAYLEPLAFTAQIRPQNVLFTAVTLHMYCKMKCLCVKELKMKKKPWTQK